MVATTMIKMVMIEMNVLTAIVMILVTVAARIAVMMQG